MQQIKIKFDAWLNVSNYRMNHEVIVSLEVEDTLYKK